MRSWPAETGRGGEDERPRIPVFRGLELSQRVDRDLVHVAPDHELRTCIGERSQDVATPAERPLAGGTPGRRREMVVERNDPQGPSRYVSELRGRSRQRITAHRAALLVPRTHRVHTHDDEFLRLVHPLRRPEYALPLGERPGETRRHGVRKVVVAGNREQGDPETREELVSSLEL